MGRDSGSIRDRDRERSLDLLRERPEGSAGLRDIIIKRV